MGKEINFILNYLGLLWLFSAREFTPHKVAFRLIIIISVVDFGIMKITQLANIELNVLTANLLNIVLLAVFSTPLIYLWVINPYVTGRDIVLEEMSDLAHLDSLTKLPNRRHLLRYFNDFLVKIYQHNLQGALLVIDLDRFKLINDAYGHDVGDAILIEVGQRLQSSIRAEDVVWRIGGDEFIVLLQYHTHDELKIDEIALNISTKLIDTIKKPIIFHANEYRVSASIGVRLLDSSNQLDVEAIIKDADIAMYKSKQASESTPHFSRP